MLGKLFSNVPPENFHLAGETGVGRERNEQEKEGRKEEEARKVLLVRGVTDSG